MKIKTKGMQAFNVPNNEEGRLFLRLLKKFRNRGWYYRALGRGSRKEHGNQAGIPQQYSEWLAVYLEQKGHDSPFVITATKPTLYSITPIGAESGAVEPVFLSRYSRPSIGMVGTYPNPPMVTDVPGVAMKVPGDEGIDLTPDEDELLHGILNIFRDLREGDGIPWGTREEENLFDGLYNKLVD